MQIINILILVVLIVIVFFLIEQKKKSDVVQKMLVDQQINEKIQNDNFSTAINLIQRQVNHLNNDMKVVSEESARQHDLVENILTNIEVIEAKIG